jgi:hypothetical protein
MLREGVGIPVKPGKVGHRSAIPWWRCSGEERHLVEAAPGVLIAERSATFFRPQGVPRGRVWGRETPVDASSLPDSTSGPGIRGRRATIP